ncbi:MAG: DUF418 domain-containing protein [Pseudomonadota bacterium]
MQPLANPAKDRVVQLDALRGLAVIGIAWMNVYAFALPLQAYYNPVVFGGDDAADRLVWLVSFVFIEDKFRTLFAMLFGAGCLILMDKDQARPWRAHAARMGVLFGIGLAHSILLASNDVLRAYAIAGLALPFLRGLTSPALYAVAIGLVAVHVGGGIVVFGASVLDFYAGRLSTDAALFAERNFGNTPGAVEYAMGLGREDLIERILRRSASIPNQLATLSGSLPINLAAMALGMGLWRDGMLAGKWRTLRMQRLAAACALVAIPSLLAIGWWVANAGFPGALVGAAALIVSAPFDMLLGLAYALLVIALLRPEGGLTLRLAAVGRLSLSNYIATSVIFAALFASWGLGWFGAVSRFEAFALSFVPITAMLVWSPVWLSRFGQGPLERFWRRAAKLLA